jgi:hypothetical protein
VTQLWYKSSGDVELPPIPEKPSKVDAEAALAKLNELLSKFPFDDEKDRSVALAGLMTPVLRGTMKAAPIFAVVAPEPRTGKTHLVRLCAMLATGHDPVPYAGGWSQEEMEKRIETAALAGRPILHLNNLPNGMMLESEVMCQMSSEGQVKIRKLGKHGEGMCDCRATTIFVNGNNISVASDLVPRTLVCRLDAQMEQPGTRSFDFDPINDRVRGHRGTYLAAIFTVARAFIAAGRPTPEKLHAMAGYEEWSRWVQQPLMWLGMDDPCKKMEEARALDPKLEEVRQLLTVLKKYRKELAGKFAVADCAKLADEMETDMYGRPRYRRQDLRDLMLSHGKMDHRSFGHLLRRCRDRRVDGWFIKLLSDSRGRAVYQLIGSGEEEPEKKEESGF